MAKEVQRNKQRFQRTAVILIENIFYNAKNIQNFPYTLKQCSTITFIYTSILKSTTRSPN